MFQKSPPSHPPTVVSLDSSRLIFCDHRTGTTLQFPFPPNSIKDLEVVNTEAIFTGLRDFIAMHKLASAELVFVVYPSAYFFKDLSHISHEERQIQTQKFLDMVPFSNVSSKLFHLNNDYKLVAINRDFYEVIKKAFENLGFTVVAVVPNIALEPIGVKDNFDIEACRVILKRQNYILENSFLTPENNPVVMAKSRAVLKKYPLIFAGVSMLLVVMAGVTAFYTLRRPARKIAAAPPPPVVEPTLTPIPTSSIASTLTVSILDSSPSTSEADLIQESLIQIGFLVTNISIATPSSQPAQTLIAYSSKVDHPLRDRVGDIVKKYYPSFSAQEVTSPSADIILTLVAN